MLLVIWLGISVGLAIAGSLLGAVIALCIIGWEAYATVAFVRAAIFASDTVIAYRAPLGRLRSFARADLSRVVVGRPIMGLVGRPPRIVFESLDGAALIALDPAIWATSDVARIAQRLNIPVRDWLKTRPRSLGGHMLMFAAAALALGITIAAAVTAVVMLVSR